MINDNCVYTLNIHAYLLANSATKTIIARVSKLWVASPVFRVNFKVKCAFSISQTHFSPRARNAIKELPP